MTDDAPSPRQARLSPGAAGRRLAELLLLFGAVPLILATQPARVIPMLVAVGLVIAVVLILDRAFDRRVLYRIAPAGWRAECARFGLIWIGAVVLITPAVALLAPDRLLELPRRNTGLWAAIMILYPLFSVYPQEVIFRAFFFHRYRPILRSPLTLILVNALAFGLAHALFRNWIAIGMTTVGGALFAWTYSRTRSIPLVCLEHALYGCFVFTVGLGHFFYAGAAR
jgi:membrane protease YdiL (CAAX protease family)